MCSFPFIFIITHYPFGRIDMFAFCGALNKLFVSLLAFFRPSWTLALLTNSCWKVGNFLRRKGADQSAGLSAQHLLFLLASNTNTVSWLTGRQLYGQHRAVVEWNKRRPSVSQIVIRKHESYWCIIYILLSLSESWGVGGKFWFSLGLAENRFLRTSCSGFNHFIF